MNLSERYNPTIKYEDIKVGNKLIVSELIKSSEIATNHKLSIGDEVIVIGQLGICSPKGIEDCGSCQCRGICFTVKNDKYQYGTSCWYKFKTKDRRFVV